MKRTIGKFFFFIAIKTPIAALFVISVVSGILLFVVFQAQVSIYEKTEGSLKYERGEYWIEVHPDDFSPEPYSPGTKAIWYLQFEGKRFDGTVDGIIQKEDKRRIILIKNLPETLPQNLKDTEVLDITVELFSGKESIKERLLRTRQAR